LNESGDPYELVPDSVAFIPSGTIHSLVNNGAIDLEMVTVMPGPLDQGANTLYDERKERWGSSFRLEEQAKVD
jgi:quercetin dioxygenase-like cupin family protein